MPRHSRGAPEVDFLTVRDRGIRASAFHATRVTARHTGALNRGTKGGGSIFVQAEHFPHIAGRLTVREGRGDRRRGAVHHQRDQSGPEDRHRGDSALWETVGQIKKHKKQVTSKAPPAPSRTPATAPSSPGLRTRASPPRGRGTCSTSPTRRYFAPSGAT